MFNSDYPITHRDEDQLDRSVFANNIASAITSYTDDECLTIGIYGGWGDGKSSLANMIISSILESELKNNYAVIRFNPWLYSNKEDLIAQMFKEISRTFKESDPQGTICTVAKGISKVGKYANIIKKIPIPVAKDVAEIVSDLFDEYASALKDLADDEKELPEIKDRIENMLAENSIRLIITIDDFDRLNQKEIRIMFQVIKILGNFRNTVYLLMMDKEVVVHSLEKVQGGSGEDYLKKIVQVPITLPVVSDIQLTTILNQEFSKSIGSTEYSKYHDLFDNMITECVIPYVKNIRDIKRLINLFKFKCSFVNQELNLVDLFIVCCIELFDYKLYQSLITDKELLLNRRANLKASFDFSTRNLSYNDEEKAKRLAQISKSCITKLFLDNTSELNNGNFRRLIDKRYYDSYFSLSLPSDSIPTSLIDDIINNYSASQISRAINNQLYNAVSLTVEIKKRVPLIPDNRAYIVYEAFKQNYNYLIFSRHASKNTLFDLLYELLNKMDYADVIKAFKDADFSDSNSKEALVVIQLLEKKKKSKNNEVKLSDKQLSELEQICKDKYEDIKLFDYDTEDFTTLFKYWMKIDFDECARYIEHNFFNSDNSETKIICSLVTMICIDSIIIDIETLKDIIDISELYKRIVHKSQLESLPEDERNIIKAFKYYYTHKETFIIGQDGTVTIGFNLLNYETNEP